MTTLSERNCRCGWNELMEKNDRQNAYPNNAEITVSFYAKINSHA